MEAIDSSIINAIKQPGKPIPGLNANYAQYFKGDITDPIKYKSAISRATVEELYKFIKKDVESGKINANNLKQIEEAIINYANRFIKIIKEATNGKYYNDSILNERVSELYRLNYRGKYVKVDAYRDLARSKDILKGTAQIIHRMITKKENIDTAAKYAPALGSLAIARVLFALPAGEAVALMGAGNVAAICAGVFVVVYAGTRMLLENTKTGEKIDTATTDVIKNLF